MEALIKASAASSWCRHRCYNKKKWHILGFTEQRRRHLTRASRRFCSAEAATEASAEAAGVFINTVLLRVRSAVVQGASCKPLGSPPPSSFLLRLNYCLYDVTGGSIFSPMVPASLEECAGTCFQCLLVNKSEFMKWLRAAFIIF